MDHHICREGCPYHKTGEGPSACNAPLLEVILENTDSHLAYLDRDFNIVQVNSAYAGGFGGGGSLIGRNHFDLVPGEGSRRVFEQVRDTGEPVRYREEPIAFADQPERGVTRWDWTLSPVKRAGGEVEGLVLSMTDVTGQVRAREALVEADRRKDEFLALLAHELRNPLAPLINAAQILGRADRGEVRDEALAVIERQVWHMVRLIDDLLDVSRITSGKIRLRKERVELAMILESAAASVRPMMDGRGHRLTVDAPRDPVFVHADATRLTQVLTNLLNNAAKYTPDGGHVALAAAAVDDGVEIRVRDDGVGIAADALPHIFRMFTQVEAAVTRSAGGLGVGLALARALTDMHGGRISARSAGAGEGTEFVVRLPAAAPPAPAAEPAGPGGAPAPSGGLRILVVDDSADSARSLGQLLELMGHDVSVAHDGPRALEAADAARPDVVILDIGMPRMDGYEVARRLRARFSAGALLVVGVTGWGKEQDRARAREAGFDHHLVKPAKPAELEEILGRFRARIRR